MLVRALSTLSAAGQIRRPGEEFRVDWTEEEGRRYEGEGLVSVLEWDRSPQDAKPRKGATPSAPVDEVLHKRVERLERAVAEMSVNHLTAEEVEALRAALGTTATEEPPEVPFDIRSLLDAEDEGSDVAQMLEGSRVDDLRAVANDMGIPNLHGRMTKAALIEQIIAGLDEQRARYAARKSWEDAQDSGGA